MMSRLRYIVAVTLPLLWLLPWSGGQAEPLLLKPYVLSSESRVDLTKRAIEVEQALEAADFELVGRYSPETDSQLLVVSHPMLRRLSAYPPGGLFLATLSVALVQTGQGLQVSYRDPRYLAHAYQLSQDLSPLQQQLHRVLGAQRQYGAAGMTPEALAQFRFDHGMERFQDRLILGRFRGYQSALRVLEKQLAAHASDVEVVYRIDFPAQYRSVVGLAFLTGEAADAAQAGGVDRDPLRRLARLPYPLVVQGGEIYTLHPRFKLPLDFPDLERTGRRSFTRLIRPMREIEARLRALFEVP